jgi:diguanylate cyclase (GGDEF)-like protein
MIILVISYRRRKRYRKVNDNLNELAGRIEELVREIECGSVCDISRIDAEDIIDEDIVKTDDIDLLGDKILKMQDHIREHISLIHEMAYIDALTGVRNKSAYLETIKNLNGKIKEQATDFAVAVFDLNGLKEINDNQGHVLGDIAISDAAACLKAAFKTDNLYRIGGDEFICIIIKPRPDEIAECFRRLEHEIAGVNKMDRAYKVELGISKGAARYEAGIDNDFISVFKRADQAMYDDKRNYYLSHGDRRRNRINTDRQNDEK